MSMLRLSALLLGALCLSGQELHYQAQIYSREATFYFDVSSVSDTTGASFTLRNNTGSSLTFPAIWNYGAAPPVGAIEIVTPLKAIAVSDEDFAIRAWTFVLDHETHYCSAGSPDMWVNDPMQILYGYGVGCCDQIAPILGWLWKAAGYNARIATMAFHTIPEIYYANAWHMLDPDHQTFYRDKQGSIASVAEILADPSIVANSGDSNGRDPVGYLSQTMAQLYASNAATLSYSPIPGWPDNGAQYFLAPGESAQFHYENPTPTSVLHPIPGNTPMYSGAFGSVTFNRSFDFNKNGLSYADASSHVQLATETDGRKALTPNGITPSSLTLSKTSPFPILSLSLKGEFFVANSSSSLTVEVSRDGVTWTNPIPVPVVPGATPSKYTVNLSDYVYGSNALSVKVLLNGSSNDVQIFSMDLETEAQFSQKMFPKLQPGQVNTFSYQDQSPIDQTRAIDVELAIPNGSPELPSTKSRQEFPSPSTACNIEGNPATNIECAYPYTVEYILTLEHQSNVKQVSLWWDRNGRDSVNLNNWILYGRNAPSPWVLLSRGGTSDLAISDIPVNTTVTDIRIVATSVNPTGLSLVKAYGDEITPPAAPSKLTSTSLVTEDPTYSLAAHYEAANLTDGDLQTLAYPAATNIDYVVSLNGLSHVSGATITWGYFGTNPIFIDSWNLYGRDGTGQWNLLNSGGFPATPTTSVPLNAWLTDLRIVAHSQANWIGIYELQIGASSMLTPIAVTSNVASSGNYGYPTANLSDGDSSTLAYPGATSIDYELDFGSDTLIDVADIYWGYFGSNPIYIQSWEVLGQRDQDTTWTSVSRGGFPNSSETWADIHQTFRKLRIRANSSNWIGIYEFSVYGTPLSRTTLNN